MRRRWLRRRTEPGQALIEMALLMPFLVLFGLVCVQFAVLYLAYMSVVTATRDAARWTSVHPHALDTTTVALVNARLPTNLNSARLTVAITPACTTLVSGKCSARTPGTQLEVTLTYDVTDILFLPATINLPGFSASIPRTLPAYSMFVQVEPS